MPPSRRSTSVNPRASERWTAADQGPQLADRPGTIRNGDLMLYASNTLLISYVTFKSSCSCTRLDRVNEPAALPGHWARAAFGLCFPRIGLIDGRIFATLDAPARNHFLARLSPPHCQTSRSAASRLRCSSRNQRSKASAYGKCRLANARPDPDFRYRSNALAASTVSNSIEAITLHGRQRTVEAFCPALCHFSL
jgi:hypothetical protein